MKNLINLVFVAAVFVLLSLGCGGGASNSGTSSAPSNAATGQDEKPVAIQAKALTKEYDENELSADGKYKGKMLAVSGKVSNIAETLGNVTAQLEGHNMVISVMCNFDESEKAAVAALKKGQQTTFVGKGDGKTGGLYVGLQKCKIQ